MKLKRTLTALAATALLCTSFASAYQNEAYGNRSFRTVTVPMDGTVKGSIVLADDSVVSDRPAADLINAAAAKGQVRAAINGMFFASYYKPGQPIIFPDNTPLVLTNLARDGQAIVGNGPSNSIGFTADGRAIIDRVDMQPGAWVDDVTVPVKIWSVNADNKNADAVILITDQMGLPYTMQPGSVGFVLQNGVATQQVSGVYTVQPGQSLLVFNSTAAANHAGWGMLPHVGGRVAIKTTFVSSRGDDWSQMTAMAGGGRMLVHNRQNVCADASYNSVLDTDPKQNATSVLQRSFAAVMGDGNLLLGTGTGSFNEIAQFLLNKGATDAVSLDGGASSMLYENGTYVTTAGRELASVLVFTADAPVAPQPHPVVPAVLEVKAQPCKASVDGQGVMMDAYNINGNNYIKLRDLACAITRYSDSDKAFNVIWNNDVKAVELTSHEKYREIGHELEIKQSQNVPNVQSSNDPIYQDGAPVALTAYKIGGANYVKLRDVYRSFDIGVQWDNDARTVVINTTESYIEP